MRLKKKEDRSELSIKVSDLILEDNEIHFIDQFVEKLDLSSHGIHYKTEREWGKDFGGPSEYDPKDLLRLYLYGYLNRTRSSRQLEKLCERNIEVIWLVSGQKPSYDTINTFRKSNASSLPLVFNSFNRFWQDLGLFSNQETDSPTEDLEDTIAVDGSKFQAQNSKSNNYNLEKIEKNLKRLDKKASDYLKQLSELDGDLDLAEQSDSSRANPVTNLENNLVGIGRKKK